MIEVHRLTKKYAGKTVVDDLGFRVEPGAVTGFLGPNGAGKSTTMRMILGLDRPTSGWSTVAGRPLRDIPHPLRTVGALLDAQALHRGRSARDHLLSLAQSNRIAPSRVDEVLTRVGLQTVAGQRVKGYSLGMRQRLGIAAAILGDPEVLLLDEPVNGLDLDGVRWLRGLLRALAAEGRTVLVSSHMMSEMALTADRLVVIGQGRLLADTTVREFRESHSPRRVRIASPRPDRLRQLLESAGASYTPALPAEAEEPGDADGGFDVYDLSPGALGEMAAREGLPLCELTPHHASLEDAYMNLVGDTAQFRTRQAVVAPAGPGHRQEG